MIADLLPEAGIGGGPPIRLRVSQIVVRQDNGTPICVIGEYGPEGTQVVAKAGDPGFNRILRALGLDITNVECSILKTPEPPPGARLLVSPE